VVRERLLSFDEIDIKNLFKLYLVIYVACLLRTIISVHKIDKTNQKYLKRILEV